MATTTKLEKQEKENGRKHEIVVRIVRSVLEYVREGLGRFAEALTGDDVGVGSVEDLGARVDEATAKAVGMNFVQRRTLMNWIENDGPRKWMKTKEKLLKFLSNMKEKVDETLVSCIQYVFETKGEQFTVKPTVALLSSAVRERMNQFRISMNRRDEALFSVPGQGRKFVIVFSTVSAVAMRTVLWYLRMWQAEIEKRPDLGLGSKYSELVKVAPKSNDTSTEFKSLFRKMNVCELSRLLNASHDMGIDPLCDVTREAMTCMLRKESRSRILEAFKNTSSSISSSGMSSSSCSSDGGSGRRGTGSSSRSSSSSGRASDCSNSVGGNRLPPRGTCSLSNGEFRKSADGRICEEGMRRLRRNGEGIAAGGRGWGKGDNDRGNLRFNVHSDDRCRAPNRANTSIVSSSDDDGREDDIVILEEEEISDDVEVEAFRKRLAVAATRDKDAARVRIEMPIELKRSLRKKFSRLSQFPVSMGNSGGGGDERSTKKSRGSGGRRRRRRR